MSHRDSQGLSNFSSVTLLVNSCFRARTIYDYVLVTKILFLALGLSQYLVHLDTDRHQMPVQKVVSVSSFAFVSFHLPGDDDEALTQMIKFMVWLRTCMPIFLFKNQ